MIVINVIIRAFVMRADNFGTVQWSLQWYVNASMDVGVWEADGFLLKEFPRMLIVKMEYLFSAFKSANRTSMSHIHIPCYVTLQTTLHYSKKNRL